MAAWRKALSSDYTKMLATKGAPIESSAPVLYGTNVMTRQDVWMRQGKPFNPKSTKATVKHVGGSIMLHCSFLTIG